MKETEKVLRDLIGELWAQRVISPKVHDEFISRLDKAHAKESAAYAGLNEQLRALRNEQEAAESEMDEFSNQMTRRALGDG